VERKRERERERERERGEWCVFVPRKDNNLGQAVVCREKKALEKMKHGGVFKSEWKGQFHRLFFQPNLSLSSMSACIHFVL